MIEHGNYRIKPIREIGRGSFGLVEEVELYNRVGKLCGNYAMKTLSLADDSDLEEFKKRFLREGRYQANFVHKNIVPIYLYSLNVTKPWFIMELGISDAYTELSNGSLSLADRLEIITCLLSGVSFIHKAGYIYRDIKLPNLIKFTSGYKISDFGLVKNIQPNTDSALTAIGAQMGTQGYWAPETSYGDYSHKSDIYSIGVLLSTLVRGDVSLNGKMTDLINNCTSYMPASRYESIEKIIADFDKIKEKLLCSA
ncbi:protein kinase [Acinetobacter baumannii]|nr:protein kinase [Acinetobacter baumannii]